MFGRIIENRLEKESMFGRIIDEKEKMKKAFLFALAACMTALVVPVHAEEPMASIVFAGGDGTRENPYQVATAEQLDAVRNDLSASYELIADIDLASFGNWVPIASVDAQFTGFLDGKGHEIKGLHIDCIGYDRGEWDQYLGLFASCSDDAVIRNARLSDVSITVSGRTDESVEYNAGSAYVGALAGWASNIFNCTVTGQITIQNACWVSVGGLVGVGRNIINCTNYAMIQVDDSYYDSQAKCGGIVGESMSVYGVIKNCRNFGEFYINVGSGIWCGGICGEDGAISMCVNYGNISGTVAEMRWYSSFAGVNNIGGIVGASSALVERSVNYGSMFGSMGCDHKSDLCCIGGIAGWMGYYNEGLVKDCVNDSSSISSMVYISEEAGTFRFPSSRARIANGYFIADCYSLDTTELNELSLSENATGKDTVHGESKTKEEINELVKPLLRQINYSENQYSFGGHEYMAFDVKDMTWVQAKEYCESLGGYLATISSKEENDALFGYVTSLGYENVYFGLTDEWVEGNWEWTNEETATYTNWHSGEPNGENEDEDYAQFYWKFTDGTWNDGDFMVANSNSGTNLGFICEWGEYKLETEPIKGSLEFNYKNVECLTDQECELYAYYSGPDERNFSFACSDPTAIIDVVINYQDGIDGGVAMTISFLTAKAGHYEMRLGNGLVTKTVPLAIEEGGYIEMGRIDANDVWGFDMHGLSKPGSISKWDYWKFFQVPGFIDYLVSLDDGSGGVCSGMVTSAISVNAYDTPPVASFGVNNLHEVKDPSSEAIIGLSRISASKLIKYAHIYQNTPLMIIEKENNRKKGLKGIYNAIDDYLHNGGEPVEIHISGVHRNKNTGHVLLPVGIKAITRHKIDYLVYDGNSSDEFKIFTLIRNGDDFVGWEYNKYFLDWGSDKPNARISYTTSGNSFARDLFDWQTDVLINEYKMFKMLSVKNSSIEVETNNGISKLNSADSPCIYPIVSSRIQENTDLLDTGNDLYWLKDTEYIRIPVKDGNEIKIATNECTMSAITQGNAVVTMNTSNGTNEIDMEDIEDGKGVEMAYGFYEVFEDIQEIEKSTIRVKGDDFGYLKSCTYNDGIVVESDDLSKAVIEYTDNEKDYSRNINSEENRVYVKWDENRISLFIDADQNGTYETEILENSEPTACGEFGFCEYNGKKYWYEDWTRQGVYGDPKNVRDVRFGEIERGREICEPEMGAWYWLDAAYEGAMAASKEVWMPYVYQGEDKWEDEEIRMNADHSDDGVGTYIYQCMKDREGKWVRYDAEGKMLKGWITIEGELAELYPGQKGNTYYYDHFTGAMVKGDCVIDGEPYHFDEITGMMTE